MIKKVKGGKRRSVGNVTSSRARSQHTLQQQIDLSSIYICMSYLRLCLQSLLQLLPGETSEHLVKGAWGSPPLALCIRVMVACISFSHLISLISLSTTLTLNQELGIRRDVEITIPKPEGNQGSSFHLHLRLLLPPGSFYPVPLPSNQYQVLSLPRNLYSLLWRCILFRCIVYEESTETRHPLMRINPRASQITVPVTLKFFFLFAFW